jgi:hypothetical protein
LAAPVESAMTTSAHNPRSIFFHYLGSARATSSAYVGCT